LSLSHSVRRLCSPARSPAITFSFTLRFSPSLPLPLSASLNPFSLPHGLIFPLSLTRTFSFVRFLSRALTRCFCSWYCSLHLYFLRSRPRLLLLCACLLLLFPQEYRSCANFRQSAELCLLENMKHVISMLRTRQGLTAGLAFPFAKSSRCEVPIQA
jgi:hypothetical protein